MKKYIGGIYLLTTVILFGCNNKNNKLITNNFLNNESFQVINNQAQESFTNILPKLQEDWKLNKINSSPVQKKSETINVNQVNSVIKKTNRKKYLIIGGEIPNLYRASLFTGESIGYLIKKNNLKNKNIVINKQKIYY